ncbi:hypothetical protein F4804DRAFT_331886 [Jackrogersella minutella]|nr:hypothetical protein F4804DRAFT_331886 [Jackrogersella minutella]
MSDTSGEVRWSHEADGLLCMMKASENNSDEVIAGMLTRTEDEVQRRTEHLSGIAADAGLTIKNLADIYKEEVKRTRTYKEYLKTFEAMSSNLDRHATLEQQLDLPAMANKKIQERLSEKERKSGRPSKGKEIFGIGWDEDEGAGLEVQVRYDAEQPAQEFNNVVPAALDENSPSDLDWDAASPDHDGNDGSPEYDSSPEGSPPRADFLDVLEDMYPRHKEIPSDDFFSERDCKAISLFEARYRADKWLKIAADFANATGRSVEPEILRAKFKKA